MADKLYSNNKIINIVNKLLKHCQSENMKNLAKINRIEYLRLLRTEYEDFSIAYPALFNLIIEEPDNFDLHRLIYMLNLKNSIDEKKTTFEQASSKIGQEYYNEFVKPNIDEEGK